MIRIHLSFQMSMLLLSTTAAFLFSQDTTHPYLSRFADAQTGQMLHIDLDIAPQGDASLPSLLSAAKRSNTQYASRMYITNMVVELQNSPRTKTTSAIQELNNSPTYVPPMIAKRIKNLSDNYNNNKPMTNSLTLNVNTP